MSKLKTHKGAAKRFTQTKGGIKFRRSNRAHILTKRGTQEKRRLRVEGRYLADCDTNSVERLLSGS
ncbi:MAG: 50S ribosomal protein L35 [Legionellales bacterium]|nr:50S ribosomal protein L35 [Legionellales bacterium]